MFDLSSGERAQLQLAVAEYLVESNFMESAKVFCREAGISVPTPGERQTLERRWRSVLRLQRRVVELERGGPVQQTSKEWSVRAPSVVALKGHRGGVSSVAAHSASGVVVSAAEDGAVKLWDVDRRALLATLASHIDAVTHVSLDEDRLLACSADGTAKLYDLVDDGAAARATLRGHEGPVLCGSFLPARRGMVATAGRDGDVRAWDERGFARRVSQNALGEDRWVRAIAAVDDADDDCWLALAGSSDVAHLSRVSPDDGALDAETVRVEGHAHQLEAVAWAPKTVLGPSLILATASRDATVRVWRFDAPRRTVASVAVLDGHASWVRALCWFPCAKRLVTASDDRSLKVWEVQAAHRCLRTIDAAHASFVTTIALHGPSAQLVSGGADKLIKLWDCR
ncbi:hypothetical protein CTAYLR_007555 [Chrysophaeum taylorii]|uniref:Lissencephaly-1 homolog n=1 Tax=Chrysophaeum taylorii TaxID=2483200 RepID=A0AAD7U6W5_9STRA|nr:hypothetical protein CTAYLR_007555 [Chrysophaeum taylorii]